MFQKAFLLWCWAVYPTLVVKVVGVAVLMMVEEKVVLVVVVTDVMVFAVMVLVVL